MSRGAGAAWQAPDEEPVDHPVLHAPAVARMSWSPTAAIAVVAVAPLVLGTVLCTTTGIREPPVNPLAPHPLLPAQPRAPPLG